MLGILFLQFGRWFFLAAPVAFLKTWKNILVFILEYFSVVPLIKTFFAPWRGIAWHRNRGFDLGNFFSVAASNLISRFLGAIVRTFLIALGITAEISFLGIGILLFFAWFLLPILIVLSFIYGLLLWT
ncbi:MAG: hypothetical protein HYV77_00675 [Candidatus Wildermuthbacteria bacterium]|nr:hypothetical protein [Candidatus Wildermuthbacteria bacterium]